MAQEYYTILTNAGLAYEAQQKAQNKPITLVAMAIGDGNGAAYNPDPAATTLRREVHRQAINSLLQDANNPTWLVAEAWLADDVGGWTIREVGIYTDTGVLYAIAKYPESIKPLLASGSGKQFYVRTIFQTSNVASVVLQVDNSVVMATRAFVVDYVRDELAKLDSKQSVRVATTANIALTGLQMIDGVALAAGDRVLVKDQAAAKDNGIYVAVGGVWARAADADTAVKLTPELAVGVEQGTVNGDSLWMLTTDAPIMLGTTALVFDVSGGRPLATKAWVQALTASDDRAGIVELATPAEADIGIDPLRAISPASLRSVLPRTAFNIPNGVSVNGLNLSGLYYANGAIDGPSGVAAFFGWVRHSAVTPGVFAFQEAFDVNGGFWRRFQQEGVWSTWVPVQTKDQTDSRFSQFAVDLAGKESSIPEGADDTYWAGGKTWKPAADIAVRGATADKSGVVLLARIEDVYDGESLKALPPSVAKSLSAASGMVVLGQPGVTQWVVPDVLKYGAKKAYVIVVGAGGGCPLSGGTLSRGGGGGGSSEGYIDLTGVSSVSVTVGAGSAGAGGASSFGSYMSATGGSVGQIGTGAFSGGGQGIGGTINREGSSGGGPDSSYNGEGGSSPYAVGVPRSSSGISGKWPGGGAGAGTDPGNFGANGAVIIKW